MDHGQRASDQAGGDSVGAACGPPLFCVSEKKGEKRPETLQKEKKPIGRPTIHPSFPRGLQTKKIRQNHPETIQKKKEERDAENEQEAAGGMGLLPEPPKPNHLQRPVPQLPA